MRELFWVFLLSAVPIVEQRGAIPLGFFYGYNPLLIFIVGFLGSLLPVPFILLLFNTIYNWLKKNPRFEKVVVLIDSKISKNKGKIEKYKEISLIAFVAIPLPTTGLWTGSAIAAFLGLDFKKSFICVAIGGILSALIITSICMFFPTFFNVRIVLDALFV
ncbi:membrane protein [Clostridium polyendosporum]|uniref:Membrane protein n=1 Tax=Clostridium polyendosporum TaxID=69208 RepID=A0A919S0C7_9CLOT|nr:small multi-drug export protein [Clostridium polyendosporum]GIM28283.1 membrane protein [Clostridium polyendosporum]